MGFSLLNMGEFLFKRNESIHLSDYNRGVQATIREQQTGEDSMLKDKGLDTGIQAVFLALKIGLDQRELIFKINTQEYGGNATHLPPFSH